MMDKLVVMSLRCSPRSRSCCALGTYGLAAELVTEQRRALGIRMALGAERRAIVSHVLRHGLVTAGIGTVVGLVSGIALTRGLRAMLYEIDPLDPLTFCAVPLLIFVVTAAASALPAARAARLDPATMLRE